MDTPDEILRAKLNLETARLAWSELERHFARGSVVAVAAELDLVETALQVARNNSAAVESWLAAGQLRKPDAADAVDWHARGAGFWAVVVAPWILVQEVSGCARRD